MPNTIKIKRRPSSGSAGKPSSLFNGELAFNESDNILYYGYGSGVGGAANSIEQIGGSGYFAHRGGINASGLWPISVTGNSATVTNGVYTTGNQIISGVKTFQGQILSNSGISIGDTMNYLIGTGLAINYGDGGGILASFVNASSQSNNSINLNAITTFNRVDGAGSLPFIISPTGYASSGAVTQGFWRGSTIEVNKGGTGQTSYSNGQLLIGSGTGLAANTLTPGDGVSITNGSGTISIAVDSTVVRTTGVQTMGGEKTFSSLTTFNSGIRAVAINTSSNDVGYFAVFDNNPASSVQVLKSVSKSDVLDDIGGASSGIILTAGSGLVGGGSLSASRTFDIGQGDGITVSTDSIAVDSTVVRSTSVNVSGYVPVWASTGGKTLNVGYQISNNLTTNNSAEFLPRADAVKTYVDNMIVSGIATNDAMIFKGSIDCSTNPNYPAADRGWTYKVSVAGKIGGASGPTVEVNDTLICTTDGTSAGTHASVGSNWVILQTNIVDASILVTGPNSSTSGNIAMFDGTTGKIIKDGGFLASDIARINVSNTFVSNQNFSGFTVYTEEGAGIFKFTHTSDSLTISPTDIGNSSRTITLMTSEQELTANRTIYFPDKNGTVALFSDITTTNISGVLSVDKGGTGQSSYTNGQLLIGNTTGNTLTKATLTEGTGIDITNGNGSITIAHEDTSTLTGAQGSNGIASITVDGLGHVTAVTTATYLTAGTVCAAIVDCSLDGGSF